MVTVDQKRFKEIFREIFLAYSNRSGIFETRRAENFGPQKIYIPKGVSVGSIDHIYWIALVALSDKRTNSAFLYKRFAEMFSRNPSLFKRRVYPSVRRMTQLFEQYEIALPRKEIPFFLERKRHLDMFFDGDPVKIYEGVSNINELMKKLKYLGKQHGIKLMFPGAKEKIFSLLAMFLHELVTFEFADVVPIDTWVLSIAISTRAIKGTGRIKDRELERMLRPLMSSLYQEFRQLHGTSNATWILGNVLCARCSDQCAQLKCPVYDKCKGPSRWERDLGK